MSQGVNAHRVITSLGLLAASGVAVAGCSSPASPDAKGSTMPPERTSGPPASDVPSAQDDPSPSGPATSADCVPVADVVKALRKAGVVSGSTQLRARSGPDCAGDFVAARFRAEGTDGLQVVLKRSGSTLTLVTAGSGACSPQRTQGMPTSLRDTLGCS